MDTVGGGVLSSELMFKYAPDNQKISLPGRLHNLINDKMRCNIVPHIELLA